MKCRFVVDVPVDVSTMAETEKAKVEWRSVQSSRGQKKLEAYFPAGTEYDHPDAAFFCDRGMAVPADAECEAAAVKLTPEQRAKLELEYKADMAGVVDPHDRELFMAGVIAGYEQVEGQTAYRPGPNYAKWKKAQDAIKPDNSKI